MTTNVIQFPSFLERETVEFKRHGSSTYTRAIDEAAALWDAVILQGDRLALMVRVAALADLVARLARHRPEVLGDFVALGTGNNVELQLVPGFLRSAILMGLDCSKGPT